MAEAGKIDTEDLPLQIEEELLKLTVEDLKKFGEYIKIPKEKYDGKSKLKAMRVIRSDIEEEIEERESPSEFLDDIQVYFTKEPPALEGETGKDETTDNSDKKDQHKAEVVKVNSAENDTISTKGVVNTNVKYESVSTGNSPELLSPTSALKKDFRIIGQVGQSGNKDKLAFSGLCRQIDEGLSKGYTEHDVISGVLNAISPASCLSGYLHTVKDLSLVQLKRILRVWLNENSSSELYQNLSVMYQLPNETTQEFFSQST